MDPLELLTQHESTLFMRLRKLSLLVTLFISLSAISLLGCGSGVKGRATEVEGTINLDGTPLVKVRVEFYPEDESLKTCSSFGMTDDKGHYSLLVNDGRKGAVEGKQKVVIQSERADARSNTPGSPRPVPEKYTLRTSANPIGTVEVSSGKKTYDFELQSK